MSYRETCVCFAALNRLEFDRGEDDEVLICKSAEAAIETS